MPKTLRILLAIVSLVGVVLARPAAQTSGVDPSLLQAMRWRSIGPYRGGRVTAVAGVIGDTQTYFMGATGGGVWKTDDAGITWRNVSDGFVHSGSVGAIAVAASAPQIVYVGMGEACLRGNLSQGDGVYKSADGGKTWKHLGLDDTRQIGRVLVHPSNPDVVYVAAIGHPYGPNAERGVFRSTDGGATWKKVLFVDERSGAVDLALDPRDPRTIFATTWQVLRTPWGITSVGPGGNIHRSRDGGDTWTILAGGLPQGPKGKIGIAASLARPGRLWATVEAEPGGGVYMSDDGGDRWQLMNGTDDVRLRQYYYGHIYADPVEPNTVYTFSSKSFLKSTDAGRTYTEIFGPHGDYHDLWIDPKDNRRMVNGNDGGATVTFNGGRTWSTIDNQPTAQFYVVTTDNQVPYRIYGSQQDNTTVSIASRSVSGTIDVTDWYPVAGGESGYLAPNPEDGNIVYGGSYFGHLTRYDHRTRSARNITVWPDYPGGRVAADMKYRFQWTFPIIVSRHAPHAVYTGAQVVFRSLDEGQSWAPISPDLTRNDKERQRGGRLEEYYSTVFTLAESPLRKGVLWAGSDDGLVHVTEDDGASWRNVTPKEMAEWSRVNIVEASPHDPAAAYLAVNRYQLDDFSPYVYRTADLGQTWQRITSGLPDGAFVRTVREDPARRGLLYAGTETGVHVSFDNGDHWQALQLNLPVVPVTDLAVKEGDLVASTQGRSFWVLDDLSALRQMRDEVATSAVHVFTPRPAIRTSRPGFSRPTPGTGQNPPAGAVVFYTLRSPVQTPVTIEFLDGAGKSIAKFSSAEPGAGSRGPRVTAGPGLNRFEWDMRYPDAVGLEGGTHLAGGNLRGPVAVPGRYGVRVTSGTASVTEALEIQEDPRFTVSAADLQKQFELLITIRDRVSAAHDAVNRLRRVPAGPRREAAEALIAELVDLQYTGLDDQMLVRPLKINNRMAALQGYVSAGEAAPTAQQGEVFQNVSAELETLLDRARRILDEARE